jgi:hypothetical protein
MSSRWPDFIVALSVRVLGSWTARLGVLVLRRGIN